MRNHLLHPWIVAGLLAGALAGPAAPAEAPGSPWAWSLGYDTCKLRPAHGSDQVMNGFAIGGEYAWRPAWSWEGSFIQGTGSQDGGVDLRHQEVLAGVRYACPGRGPWRGFAHLQAGFGRLRATAPLGSDHRDSLAVGTGAGAEYRFSHALSARAQADLLLTRYAGERQLSPSLILGLVYRP